jgi:hypothetical protein
MRWHCIRDRIRQGHFSLTWYRGADNLADYFTKAHPANHTRAMRSLYVS